MKIRAGAVVSAIAMFAAALSTGLPASGREEPERQTTAWRAGALQVDTPALLSRSDVVLEGPGWRPHQSMPLGNGKLGAAVWAEEGFTAQLNRTDLFPDLKSPGQLVVPGLDALMRAPDYRGRLNLYDGRLVQSGGGMSATAYVDAKRDLFVLEVTGADPAIEQTADLRLWSGRSPTARADGSVASLAETFVDEASGRRTGAVAAATAAARDVSASVVDPKTVRLRFRPQADGSFRVVVGVPFVDGSAAAKAAKTVAAKAVAGASDNSGASQFSASHRLWWHEFWRGVAPMKITSDDGTGEYMENLRALQLYTTAASMRSSLPASHGAVIPLFSSFEDHSDWSPAHFWHFNLRMQTAANFAADTEEFNAPYFRLYQDNLASIRKWTRDHLPDTDGICVPETIRFDGTGSYPGQIQCDTDSPPNYVVRIMSTGPEVALNIWKHYRYTNDAAFLDDRYPFMRDVVLFYLSYAREGSDGLLHLDHVNAFENQWDTKDPATDLAAMKVLFPLVANLAVERGDNELANRLRDAIPKIPPFRTVQRNGEEVIAWSATDEPSKNAQNPDLEPVWPWGLYGDSGDEGTELARSTFRNRVYPQAYDWGMDSTWAARLGLAEEIPGLLVQGTKDFQAFSNGFSFYGKGGKPSDLKSFYNEWGGVVTTGLQEALVQSYDGLIRVPAAWPKAWDVDTALQIEGGHRVSVQVRDGVASQVGIKAARSDTLRVRNPWPGQEARVVNGATGRGAPVVKPTRDLEITIPVSAGRSYLIERTEYPHPSFEFAPVSGTAADKVKKLDERTIGVLPSSPPKPCVVPTGNDPVVDWNPESGDTITDGSSQRNDATIVGGGAYSAGPDGPALVLDGQRYVRSNETVSLGKLAEATFFSQVRVRGSGTYRRLWDYIPPGTGGDTGFLVDLTPANKIRFIGANQVVVTDAALPVDRFVALAVTYGKDGTIAVYLDGDLAWSGTVPPGEVNGCAELALQFGADQNGGSRLAGDVDDMTIWTRVLSAEEVKAL